MGARVSKPKENQGGLFEGAVVEDSVGGQILGKGMPNQGGLGMVLKNLVLQITKH